VAADELVEGPLQRRRVESPLEAGCERYVVGGAPRVELVEKPEPFLDEREGQLFGAL
jgi:hypothetical protein